jgi:peptide/nickel transport system substrate-binding protein
VRQGPLKDVRVRQAICHLIDSRPLVQYKFHGLARPATGMLPANHWAYASTQACTHDVKEAGRLLDAAGYPTPLGGGPRLRLSYKTSTDRFRKSVALVLAEQLSEGGVTVDLRPLEFGTFFSDVRTGNFDMITLKWSTTFEPDLLREVFSSSQIPSASNQFGGLNRGGYSNEVLDDLLDRAVGAAPQLRRELYAKAQAILAQDLPYVPLWHEDTVAVVSSRLVGFRPSATGFLSGLASAAEAP